jgi:hypothetical protein
MVLITSYLNINSYSAVNRTKEVRIDKRKAHSGQLFHCWLTGYPEQRGARAKSSRQQLHIEFNDDCRNSRFTQRYQ